MKNKTNKIKPKKLFLILTILLFNLSLSNGQDTLDFSNNKIDNTISIAGTYLNIDTTGLNLIQSELPRAFINENEQTVFSVEQKILSIKDYESVIGSLIKFDTVLFENLVKFDDFTGKQIIGKVNIQSSNKYIWFYYIGNSEIVIEIKGFYNENLHSKYEKSFEKAIKSVYINKKRTISIYEDLPFYLDESKFLYEKELSFMPQSITISRQVGENKRVVSLTYFESDKNEIEELRKNPDKDDYFVENEKEIFSKIDNTDDESKFTGIIINGIKLIQFHCSSAGSDLEALSEFKEMIKALKLK